MHLPKTPSKDPQQDIRCDLFGAIVLDPQDAGSRTRKATALSVLIHRTIIIPTLADQAILKKRSSPEHIIDLTWS